MKKKVLSIVLALFMILGLGQTFTKTVQAAGTTDWKDAYAAFLKNPDNIKKLLVIGDSIDDARFSLRDIDNNGVPELIVSAGYNQYWEVFTYDNGIKDTGFGAKRGYLISSNAQYPGLFAVQGEQHICISYITIKTNELTQVDVSEENLMMESPEKSVFDKTLDSISENATDLPTYSISNFNIADIITNYGESNTAPHPYATALRDYFKDATGYTTAYLADINGDGTKEMIAEKDISGGPMQYRFFYFYNGKLCTYDKSYAQGSLFVSPKNYLVDYRFGLNTEYHILTVINGSVVESNFFGAYYDMDNDTTTYYQNNYENNIPKSTYDALLVKYGLDEINLFISENHVNRPDQTAQILAMATAITSQTNWKNYKETKEINTLNKEFTVKFNKALKSSTVNNENIYVATDENGQNKVNNISVQLSNTGKEILVNYDNKSLWESGKTYYLFITTNLQSAEGKNLNDPIRMKFTVR